MRLCDIVIAILLGIVIVLAILYQFGSNDDLVVKNCIKTSVNDQQLAECVRNVKR